MATHPRKSRAIDKDGAPRRAKGAESPHCRAQRLQRKRMYYARGRLSELQKVCPQVTEDLIAHHGLHKISWSVRRAGKRPWQSCLPRSAPAKTGEILEKDCAVQHDVQSRQCTPTGAADPHTCLASHEAGSYGSSDSDDIPE